MCHSGPASGSDTRPAAQGWWLFAVALLPACAFCVGDVHADAERDVVDSRRIADRRVFPAFDLIRSGTRKEELLTPKEHLNRVWILRRLLQEMNPVDAIEFIIDKMRKTQTNKDFFDLMSQ